MSDVPDVYADHVQVMTTEWGVLMGFRATSFPIDIPIGISAVESIQVETQLTAIVRMGHVHAKALAVILRNHLKDYESRTARLQT